MQDGKTALILATSSGNLSVVDALLKAKAKIDLPEKVIISKTCVMYIMVINDVSIVHVGCHSSSQNGNTALMEASESGHTAVVKTLLDNGADIEKKNKVCGHEEK